MKLLLLFMMVISMPVIAQQNPTLRQEQPVDIDYFSRLWIEFEIKDNPSPDPDLIHVIPFEKYNHQRHATIDLEFIDPTTNYVIILYSEDKCKLNKH